MTGHRRRERDLGHEDEHAPARADHVRAPGADRAPSCRCPSRHAAARSESRCGRPPPTTCRTRRPAHRVSIRAVGRLRASSVHPSSVGISAANGSRSTTSSRSCTKPAVTSALTTRPRDAGAAPAPAAPDAGRGRRPAACSASLLPRAARHDRRFGAAASSATPTTFGMPCARPPRASGGIATASASPGPEA